MPRRRDAACGPRRFGPAFPGSSAGLPGGVWSARWAVPMEGGYLAFWRETRVSRRKCQFLAERRPSTEKGFRFRLREIERLDRDRPWRLLFTFFVAFELGFVGERPPDRFHPFVIIFVAHRATFGPRISARIHHRLPFSVTEYVSMRPGSARPINYPRG